LSEYNAEQLQTINEVLACLGGLSPGVRNALERSIADYLAFRRDVDRFLDTHFSAICSYRCYQSGKSVCCGREGITTFFADIVVNLLVSSTEEIQSLKQALRCDPGSKCVYLCDNGCLWHIKPIVCEMFLCKPARDEVFGNAPEVLEVWQAMRRGEKGFTWPSQPVLFDELETFFMERGCGSSLMYFHNSPGLLRVKAKHQVSSTLNEAVVNGRNI